MLRRAVVCLVLAGCGLWSSPADACTCGSPGLPCEAVWRADAVFVGNVVSIDAWNTPEGRPFGSKRVHMAVLEAFRGIQLAQVTIVTAGGESACGYSFRMGESYFVYASRSQDGQLSTGLCTRTRPVSDAAEDLAYARSLTKIVPGAPARVAGRVQLWQWPQPPGGELRPMPDIVVTAKGEGRTVSATTNERGQFELTGLRLGKYELVAQVPEGFAAIPRPIEIHDPRGCDTPSLYVRHDGRVFGRVVDSSGAAVRGLPLELVVPRDLNRPGHLGTSQTWTQIDGSFELQLVPPGEYLLGFNSFPGVDGARVFPCAFHPGVVAPQEATRIEVGAGERVRTRDFIVPESIKLVAVSGTVVDEANQPVGDATVVLRDRTEGPNLIGPRFTTAADGTFLFALVERGRYEVHVSRYVGSDARTREAQVSIVPFTALPDTKLTVILKPRDRR